MAGTPAQQLFTAFHNNDKEKVLTLLTTINNPAKIRAGDNETLLHYAIRYGGWVDVCQVLVEVYHVDPHLKSTWYDLTALHWACDLNCHDIAKYLVIHAHCDPFVKDAQGQSPFYYSFKETREFLEDIIDKSKKAGFTSVVEYTKAIALGITAASIDESDGQSFQPLADLSAKVTPESPFLDHWDHGIHISFDRKSFAQSSSGFLANVQMYSHDPNASQVSSFTFPEESQPVSAIYSISLPPSSAVSASFTLKIMHFADSNRPEELKNLCFVKSIDHSPKSGQFEVVRGGSFRKGECFGEIKLQHASFWSIVVESITKVFRGPSLYRGVIHYILESANNWIMQLIVTKYERIFALNEHMKRYYGLELIGKGSSHEFLFKFTKSRLIVTVSDNEIIENNVIMCKNGWRVALDVCQISQEFADKFKQWCDVPGKCVFKIRTKEIEYALEELPLMKLNGIESDIMEIRVNPPIEGSAAMSRMSSNLFDTSDPPTTAEQVFTLLRPYSAKWYEFGRELNVSHNDRENLRLDGSRSVEMKLEEVIRKWVESECSPVTWDNLIQIFKKLGYIHLVNTITSTMSSAQLPLSPIISQHDTTKQEAWTHIDHKIVWFLLSIFVVVAATDILLIIIIKLFDLIL